MRSFIFSVSLLALVSLVTFPAFSAYQLDNQLSSLSFISIKKGDIAEVHQFNQLAGSVDDNGKVSFSIDLSSVNTNIPIRDDRMKEHLFNINVFPKATFNAQLDMTKLSAIQVGSSGVMKLTGDINLHGQTQKVMLEVLVANLSDNKLVVSSMKPVIINAQRFALVDGVKKLQELAGLPSISNAVPLSFVLSFKK